MSRSRRRVMRNAGFAAVVTAATAVGVLQAPPAAMAVTCAAGLPLPAAASAGWSQPGGVAVKVYDTKPAGGATVRVAATRVDLTKARLRVSTAGKIGAASPTTALTRRVARAVAAVNGDYFDLGSWWPYPVGAQVVAGSIQRVPAGSTPVVGMGTDRRLHVGSVTLVGRVTVAAAPGGAARVMPVRALNISERTTGLTATTTLWSGPAPAGDVAVVLSGGKVVRKQRPGLGSAGLAAGQVLVTASGTAAATLLRSLRTGQSVTLSLRAAYTDSRTGKPSTWTLVDAIGRGGIIAADGVVTVGCTGSAATNAKRVALGWDATGRTVWLITVEQLPSRRSSHPRAGATYRQVALAALSLGARNVLLLDGGGSTTMTLVRAGVVRRVDVDDPAFSERAVANALVVVPG